jgi:hypothetical protein
VNKLSTKPIPFFLDRNFLGTTFLGAVSVGAVSVFGSLEAQVAMLGTWLSILAGLVLTQIQNSEQSSLALKKLLGAVGLSPRQGV